MTGKINFNDGMEIAESNSLLFESTVWEITQPQIQGSIQYKIFKHDISIDTLQPKLTM